MKKIVLSLAVISAVVLTSCENTNTQKKNEMATEQAEQMTPETTQKEASKFAYAVSNTSVVEWIGSKPTGKHNGTISVSEGGVNVENGAVTSGKFVIDMNSITVLDLPAGDGKEDLEEHLKGTGKEEAEDHFFNVKKFPTSTFVLKSFDGKNITGDLTIRGISKEISFPATVTITDNEVIIESASFKVNRVDFGVNYGSKSVFDNLKDKFINDDIELIVKVKATK